MKPCVIYGEFEIIYDGRAFSTLKRGNYLILYKPDKSIAIHGAKSKPLNYQNANSSLTVIKPGSNDFNNMLANFSAEPKIIIKSERKKEIILIAVYSIFNKFSIDCLSDNKVELQRSEHDLVNLIVSDIAKYLPNIDVKNIETEAVTPYGDVDILVVDTSNAYHIIEVKRKIISVASCGQVARYGKYFNDLGFMSYEYLAAPRISKNAKVYCERYRQTYFMVEFPESSVSLLSGCSHLHQTQLLSDLPVS